MTMQAPEAVQNGAALAPSNNDGNAVAAFSNKQAFETALRMALAMAKSTLVPEAYRGETNVPNILIAMELANRINASVIMVMQNLDIIHGRPGFRASFLIATVNSCGRFTPIRFRWQGTEGTDDWGCRAVAKDRETGEECLGALITIGLAKAEGWYARSGSKWKTMPEQMTMYRAASFWTRIYAPEHSLGMQTSEELSDLAIGTSYAVSQVQQSPARDLEAALLGTGEKVDPGTGEVTGEAPKAPDSQPTQPVDLGAALAVEVGAQGTLPIAAKSTPKARAS